jgi:hypothetical protein
MTRVLGLAFVLLLSFSLSAQAAISLVPNDTVTLDAQTPGLSAGNGGQFTWNVASTVPGSGSSPVNTVFYAFCAQIGGSGGDVALNTTYTIDSFISPVVGQTINAAGNTLLDTKGLFLFDQWSSGNLAQNAANAAAVQVALWSSEGYTASDIEGAGYSASLYASSVTLEASLLSSLGYTSSWQVGANDQVMVLDNAQDQFIYNSNGVPEPASFAIWGVFGLAGAASVVASKAVRKSKSLSCS